MNVAFFSECWDPQINGVVTSTKALIAGLPSSDAVHVFAPRYPGYRDDYTLIFRQPAIRYFFQPEFFFSSPLPFAALKAVRRWRIDLVHLHTEFTLGMVAKSAARAFHIPSVLTLHTLWEHYSHYFMWDLLPLSLLRFFLSLLYRGIDYFIAPSDKAKDYLKNVMRIKRPIAVIPTGIKLEMFHQARLSPEERARLRLSFGLAPDDFVLMFAGRVGREKSIHLLIDGIDALRSRHPRLKLMIVGAGPHLRALKADVVARGLPGRVVFTGYLPYERMPAAYRAADAFAIASVSETQGLVTVEALASDLPVIARDDPAALDIIRHGKHGLVFRTGAEFSAAVDRLLTAPALAARLRETARSGSLRYGAGQYGQAVGEYYEWIIRDFQERSK